MCPKLMGSTKENSKKNAIAITEESTLVLGQPIITIKVRISLKRLLTVTFNVKTVNTQILSVLIQ